MNNLLKFSISFLCLSVSLLIGFHLGVKSAGADFEPSGLIVGVDDDYTFLLSNGKFYSFPGTNWTNNSLYDIPVPVSDLKFWNFNTIVTKTDEAWVNTGGGWIYAGVPPGGTATNTTTWGKLKSQYKENWSND